jgi:hypothetical protein
MTTEIFPGEVSPRFLTVWLVAMAAFAIASGATFAFYRTPDFGRSFALATVLLGLAAIAWRNRNRPVLEVTDDEIRWAPAFAWNPRRILIRDIDEIAVRNDKRIFVRVRSGRSLIVRIQRIDARSRDRARNSLRRLQDGIPHRVHTTMRPRSLSRLSKPSSRARAVAALDHVLSKPVDES